MTTTIDVYQVSVPRHARQEFLELVKGIDGAESEWIDALEVADPAWEVTE